MQLKRQFGPWTAASIIIAQVIGVGIFLVPAGMARSVDSPAILFTIWIGVGVMSLCGALCYAELAARFPETGGTFVYIREAFGRGAAFIFGWMVLLVVDPGLTAIFGVGFASYFGYLMGVSRDSDLVRYMAVGAVILVGLISIAGTRTGPRFVQFLTALKLATLSFIIIFGFSSGSGDAANFEPFFRLPKDMSAALAGGLVGAFFAFAGWWDVARLAGEIRDPERNFPRAMLASIGGLIVIYVLTSAVFIYLVPAGKVANDEAFAAMVGEALFGRIGGQVLSVVVAISVAGTLFAYILASPRVYYAMAREGLFLKSVGELSPRFGTPLRATLIQIVLASILILSGTFNEILGYFFFVVILFTTLAVFGLFRIRQSDSSGYKTPFYPVTPILFIILAAATMFFIAVGSPLQTAIGVSVMIIGFPVYYLTFRNRSGIADEG